jgi:hypothetical protein
METTPATARALEAVCVFILLTGAFAAILSFTLAAMLLLVSELTAATNFYIYSARSALLVLSLFGALIGPRLLRW